MRDLAEIPSGLKEHNPMSTTDNKARARRLFEACYNCGRRMSTTLRSQRQRHRRWCQSSRRIAARQLRVKALLIPAAPDDVLNLFPERWPGATSGKYRHSMPALNSTPR
jgi:hypothetical protein